MQWLEGRMAVVVLAGGLSAMTACGDDSTVDGPDASTMCPAVSCDDGQYCNGVESCDPTSDGADARGCVTGSPPCGTDPCDEAADACDRDCANADADGDGVDAVACGGTDCDDSNANVYAGAMEICDADDLDEDCNPDTFGFLDADSDGTGSAACCNGTNCGTDCDDANRNIGGGFAETCDGADNDCDGSVDEGVLTTYYADTDGDDFGDPAGETRTGCSQPAGFSENDRDCNDAVAAVNPSAPEVCDAHGDNDCDSSTVNPFDNDGDGHDRHDAGSCPLGSDCDDFDVLVHPGATESCDGKDSNCDGAEIVPGCSCSGTCSGGCGPIDPADALDGCLAYDCAYCEGDCFGSCGGTCSAVDAIVIPEDQDGDGFMPTDATCVGGPRDALPKTDCDDRNAQRYPGAPEWCDGYDNDCDGSTDENVDFVATPIPRQPVRLATSAAAPDLTCLGLRSRPAVGSGTTTSIQLLLDEPFGTGTTPATATLIELWDGEDVTALDCPGASCTSHTSDGSGAVSASHAENEMFAYVVPSMGVLGLISPSQDPAIRLSAGASIGEGLLVQGVVDCLGRPLHTEGLQLRLYRTAGSCTGTTAGGGTNQMHFRELDPPLSATGEIITAEAWGQLTAGGPFVLLARERIRIRASTLSYLYMPPLRADGPPAP